MNKGVQILLERMESNPDEFTYDDPLLSRKWRDITEQVSQRYQIIINNPDVKSHWQYALDFLDDEEIITLHNKLKALRADEFTRDVMARLLADADDGNYHKDSSPNFYQTSNPPKTLLASHEQVKAMKSFYAEELRREEIKAQQEIQLTQANLADAIQKIRAFGKGK